MSNKKNKIFIVYIFCILTLFIHVVLGQETEQPVIKVATTEYAPFDFTQNGEIVGITADIIRETFGRLGYKVELTSYPWARAVSLAKSGAVDALSVAFISEERKEFYDFPREYLIDDEQAFFVRQNSDIEFNGTLASLSDYSIGTIRGYFYGDDFEHAQRSGTIRINESSNPQESIRKLLNGYVDVVLEGRYNFLFALKQQGVEEQVRELTPAWRTANLYLAFSKQAGLAMVIPLFDRVLQEIKEDGTQQTIINRYMQ